MPAPATNDEFLELVRKAEVIDKDYLDECVQRIMRSDAPKTPHELGERLVAEGALSYYQVVQLLKGRWNCFRIGPYRILERLGFGATSNVYLCEHKARHKRVAVKVLTQIKADDPKALRRFFREAKAATLAEHPNLVQVHDVDWDNQDNFMVMDFVDGSSVQDIVQQFGPMDIQRAAHYTAQAAQGLHFLYQAGLVHRDIKPGNLLIDREGTTKILDLGLARFAEEEGGQMLTQGEVLGSPEYMSPEQAIDSHDVDYRTDIYSLGATLYFMVTGEAPYSEERSPAGKLLSKAQRPPKPVREIRPEVPEDLVQVIDKMMARDPAERYQTPRDAADALKPWTKTRIDKPPEQEMPQLSKAAVTGQGKLKAAAPAQKTPPAEAAPLPWWLALVVLGVGGAVIAWIIFGQ